MQPNLNDFTWQSLYKYIEDIIFATQEELQSPYVLNHVESSTGLKNQLELLRLCLVLVNEMRNREDMQVICPIMSVGIIRLRCRHAQFNSSDFAWILPIADGRYSLKQINLHEPKMEWLFEGNLSQVVEKVEKLVKEICAQEDH